ncbi:hypothetical protein Droror1_Dr00010139 [Drosera rotundifolia]
MDPCPFVRLTVGSLALKIPVSTKLARAVVHPASSPCFCRIKLRGFSSQSASVPLLLPDSSITTTAPASPSLNSSYSSPAAATFHLSKSDIESLQSKPLIMKTLTVSPKRVPFVLIDVYTGRTGATCGVSSGRLLGRIRVGLEGLKEAAEGRVVVFQSGWVRVGKEKKAEAAAEVAEVFVEVKAEPDPRFVFQFDGEPECSPQVFQIQGKIRQPVFTCKFSFRSTGDRSQRSRSMQPEQAGGGARGWLSTFGSERERPGKERKGWSITVHDLSGSPVAAASMVTPFVASPGSDRVSRSNPGSWLILLPGEGTWKPWGRLEAWRERGALGALGFRFELIPDMGAAGIVLTETTLSSAKGGKFAIDLANGNGSRSSTTNAGSGVSSVGLSPVGSPRGSGDFGMGLWPYSAYRGFVMSARVEGEGRCSKPTVEVSVQHVTCTEDAAAFVALAAAVDLSMDACRLFSAKLRKELCRDHDLVT